MECVNIVVASEGGDKKMEKKKRVTKKKEPGKYTHELALLRDIRTLLAFLVEYEVARDVSDKVEVGNWVRAFIEENRIL